MKKLLPALLCVISGITFNACSPEQPGTNGSGGTGNVTTTTAQGGNGTAGAGGGSHFCHPWEEDPFLMFDPACTSCTCRITSDTDPAYCQQQLELGIDICPVGGNTCEPGINKCGYDLPPGQAYELPDMLCKMFVRGDVWLNENTQEMVWGWQPPYYNEHGQLQIEDYIMSGRVLYRHMFSPQTEAASSICTFNQDCKMLTCTDEPSGTTHMFWWYYHP